MTEAPRDYNIAVLQSAIQVLETFLAPGTTEQSLSEISQSLGLNKSRAFRILSTLQQAGFVEQDFDSRNYRLGLKLLELGAAVRRRLNLVQVAAPALNELAESTGETVFLGVVDGNEAVCIDKREGSHTIRLFGEVGRRTSLHLGSIPKVLLAYLEAGDPDILDRLELKAVTPATVVDREALRGVLTQIRRDGYVLTRDDLDWGACSIAAPVRDHSGRVVAAVSVAGPNDRFGSEHVDCCIRQVRHAAMLISRQLGYAVRDDADEAADPTTATLQPIGYKN